MYSWKTILLHLCGINWNIRICLEKKPHFLKARHSKLPNRFICILKVKQFESLCWRNFLPYLKQCLHLPSNNQISNYAKKILDTQITNGQISINFFLAVNRKYSKHNDLCQIFKIFSTSKTKTNEPIWNKITNFTISTVFLKCPGILKK